jgi:hypothetical protein
MSGAATSFPYLIESEMLKRGADKENPPTEASFAAGSLSILIIAADEYIGKAAQAAARDAATTHLNFFISILLIKICRGYPLH